MSTIVDDLRQGGVERIRLSPALRARNFLTTSLDVFFAKSRSRWHGLANQRALWDLEPPPLRLGSCIPRLTA